MAACGEALSAAGRHLGAHAEGMAEARERGAGATAARREAAARLAQASGCLRGAGEAMAASGANLEAGARPL